MSKHYIAIQRMFENGKLKQIFIETPNGTLDIIDVEHFDDYAKQHKIINIQHTKHGFRGIGIHLKDIPTYATSISHYHGIPIKQTKRTSGISLTELHNKFC